MDTPKGLRKFCLDHPDNIDRTKKAVDKYEAYRKNANDAMQEFAAKNTITKADWQQFWELWVEQERRVADIIATFKDVFVEAAKESSVLASEANNIASEAKDVSQRANDIAEASNKFADDANKIALDANRLATNANEMAEKSLITARHSDKKAFFANICAVVAIIVSLICSVLSQCPYLLKLLGW